MMPVSSTSNGRYAVKVKVGARDWKMYREGLFYPEARQAAHFALVEDGYPAAKVLFREDDGTWELVHHWKASA